MNRMTFSKKHLTLLSVDEDRKVCIKLCVTQAERSKWKANAKKRGLPLTRLVKLLLNSEEISDYLLNISEQELLKELIAFFFRVRLIARDSSVENLQQQLLDLLDSMSFFDEM